MNQLFANQLSCANLMTVAERELGAFFRSVTEMFGADQAELSAQDWLAQLLDLKSLPASTRELRQITISTSARLARRSTAEKGRANQIVANLSNANSRKEVHSAGG